MASESEPVTDVLLVLRLIAELARGIENAADILSTDGELSEDQVQALMDSANNTTQGWLAELERRRGGG